MHIRSLHLQSFRSHTNTTLDLARISVIRAPNGAGKSSVEQAIEIALASRTDSTSADGKGSAGLIRAGEKKAAIKLAMGKGSFEDERDERLIECALNGTSRAVVASNPANPQWDGEAKFLGWMKAHKETFSCLTNNRYFVDLEEDQQKKILAAIILPKTYAWPEWVKPTASSVGLSVDWQQTPFEVIESAYASAYKLRTEINRDLKNFKMPEGDTSAAANLSAYSDTLAARQAELEKEVAALSARRSALTQTASIRQQANTRLSEAQGRLAREEQTIAHLDAKLLPPAKLKAATEAAKHKAKADKLDADLAGFDAEISILKQQIAGLNELAENPSCPTCATPLTEDLMAAILKPILDRRNAQADQRQATIDERKKLGNPGAAADDLKAHEQAKADLDRAKARANEERTIIADAQAKLDELGSVVAVDESEAEAKIADLRAAVGRDSTLVAQARDAANLLGRKASAEKERTALVAKQQSIEKLVAYFGADGVKTELLQASIGAFREDMNAVLAHWGYDCRLTMEPYCFAIAFRDEQGLTHDIALKNLSKSQKYRFAVAFQVALAITTGFRFVVVDEADMLDADGRQGLFQALQESELDQAIIISTDERIEVPEVEGVVFYRFDNMAAEGQIPTTTARVLSLEPAFA